MNRFFILWVSIFSFMLTACEGADDLNPNGANHPPFDTNILRGYWKSETYFPNFILKVSDYQVDACEVSSDGTAKLHDTSPYPSKIDVRYNSDNMLRASVNIYDNQNDRIIGKLAYNNNSSTPQLISDTSQNYTFFNGKQYYFQPYEGLVADS